MPRDAQLKTNTKRTPSHSLGWTCVHTDACISNCHQFIITSGYQPVIISFLQPQAAQGGPQVPSKKLCPALGALTHFGATRHYLAQVNMEVIFLMIQDQQGIFALTSHFPSILFYPKSYPGPVTMVSELPVAEYYSLQQRKGPFSHQYMACNIYWQSSWYCLFSSSSRFSTFLWGYFLY